MSSFTLQTAYGSLIYREDYWGEATLELEDADSEVQVELYVPETSDLRDPDVHATVRPNRYTGHLDPEQADNLIKLLSFGRDLCALVNDCDSGAREEAKRRAEEEQRELQRRKTERLQELESRKERLMTEFVGEQVSIRERGYKTMRKAIVEVLPVTRWERDEAGYRDVETGEYKLHFRYTGQDIRTQNLNWIQRLDVYLGGRRVCVWDDGTDDVYGSLASSANPVPMYEGQLGG